MTEFDELIPSFTFRSLSTVERWAKWFRMLVESLEYLTCESWTEFHRISIGFIGFDRVLLAAMVLLRVPLGFNELKRVFESSLKRGN